MSDRDNFVPVFETGRPHEILMVLNELEDKGIPSYGQEVTIGGMVRHMPTIPVAAPGITWVARVSEIAETEAKAIIASLPLEIAENPSVWHFGPTAFAKNFFKWMAIVVLLGLLYKVLKTLLGWLW